MCAEVKPKKTRKKAKASAMTRRAAKRGRSKRKRRSPQKLAPPALKLEPIGSQAAAGTQLPMPAQLELQQPIKEERAGPRGDAFKAEVKMEPIKLEALEQVEIEPVGDYEHQQFCGERLILIKALTA